MCVEIASAEDVPAIAALVNLAYRVEAFFVSGPRIDEATVEAALERGAFLVARDGDGLMGCVYIEAREPPVGYLGLLSVAPAWQGRGMGGQLLSAGEQQLRSWGCPEVTIRVVDLRQELFPYYLERGYRQIGVEPFSDPKRLLRPCHFVVMGKRLDPLCGAPGDEGPSQP